jgi:hypothetical protein
MLLAILVSQLETHPVNLLVRLTGRLAVGGSFDRLDEAGGIGEPGEPSSNFKVTTLLSSSSCLQERWEVSEL